LAAAAVPSVAGHAFRLTGNQQRSRVLEQAKLVKDMARQAVKDAYDGLKNLIKVHYAQVNVEQLERTPISKARKMVIEEELRQLNAQDDAKLLEKVKSLLELIRNDPKEAGATGIDLELP
jgi:hypothetical protein